MSPADQERLISKPDAELAALRGSLLEGVLGALHADPWVALERASRRGHRLDRVPTHAAPRRAPRARD
jgi:hypothetical protein